MSSGHVGAALSGRHESKTGEDRPLAHSPIMPIARTCCAPPSRRSNGKRLQRNGVVNIGTDLESTANPRMSIDEARRLLASCELHSVLGLTLESWELGAVSCLFRPPALARDASTGGVHGGALATALDTVAGFAVISVVGADITTVDLRTDFVRPALDDEFRVSGRELRVGKRFGWADATVTTLEGRVVAAARGTFIWE